MSQCTRSYLKSLGFNQEERINILLKLLSTWVQSPESHVIRLMEMEIPVWRVSGKVYNGGDVWYRFRSFSPSTVLSPENL